MHPGAVISEKYRIERLLGAGGMGSVYVATNVVLQKQVALKVMSGAFLEQAGAVERFFREAMSASKVRHPAIVEIYDAGHFEGAPWMAMELLEGESLGQRLERGPLTLAELRTIFEPVLGALDAVHAQGIVHRDLKPDNIFIERMADGRVQSKLLDFGIAKTQTGLDKLTKTGVVMGTAHYLAPEQARDSSTVDPRTDIYALGVVLYEALSGHLPHPADTLPELIAALITKDPVPLLSVAPSVPPGVANVVHWCLAREPDQRPQRCSALSHHLLEAIAAAPEAHGAAAGSGARANTGPANPLAGTALAAAQGGGFGGGPSGGMPSAGTPGAGAGFGAPPTGGWGGAGAHGHATPPPGGAGWANASPSNAAPSNAAGPVGWSSAPSGPGAFTTPPAKSGGKGVYWIVGLVGLVMACTVGAPVLLGVLSMVGSIAAFSGGGGGGGGWGVPSMTFPRLFENWRAPLLVDANGDGTSDYIGWFQQIVNTDTHEYLCAHDGRDGTELWCADLGEQDDLTDTETVLMGQHVVYLDHRGRASAFALRDGTRASWEATVSGGPEEVCASAPGQLAVRTGDQLWSVLDVATGRVTLAGESRPEGCAPVWTTTPPRSLGGTVSSPTWYAIEPRDRPRRLDEMNIEAAWSHPVTTDLLLVGQQQAGGRRAGMLGRLREGQLLWHVVVPGDPIRAQAQAPEAVAITDDLVFATYEMTARGDVPRRLTAFNIADGARLWDVGLPTARGDRAWYAMADPSSSVAVCADYQLFVFNRGNGEQRFVLGQPPRRH